MPDVASLSFDIDSSQAQRAIGVLESLKATSISVTQATNQFTTANQSLTQTYGQERDALAKLADQTKAYDGTLGGLVNKLNELRRGITGTAADFQAYARTLTTATAAAVQFNNSVEGLDRYVAKAKELRVTTQDLATGFQRMTEALRNQTVEGNQTRVMLQQLGVSLSGLNPQQGDVLLQRLADQLRQFRDSQQKIQAAQQILGPSFDAQAVLNLQNQPYQPFLQRQAQERTVAAQSQIDAQQAAIQRLTIQLQRNEAERTDLNSRYSLSNGFFGRAGLNPFAGGELSRDQQLARLRQIDQLPPEERRPYEGYGYRFGQFLTNTFPGPIVRNYTSGTFSSNQQEIAARFQRDAAASAFGYIGAAPAYLGRSAENLTADYKPQTPEDQRPQSPLERLMLQREAARVVGSYGDPSLANQIQLRDQRNAFTDPGVQQKYIDVLGQREGTRRYTGQLANITQQTLYAQQPELETQANTDREQYILSLPPEQRQRARFQLQYQRSIVGPAGDLASPGAGNTGQALLSQPQRQAGTTAFNAQVAGGLQERQEDNQRQLEFQKDLASSLDRGRGAAEDFTRAWQEYTQVKLQGATQDQADLTALNALNLALAQRVTQGKALVAQLHEENTLTAQQLAATGGTIGADVQTRRGAEISSRIQADRDRLINAGQLPDPKGGQWTDPKTGKTVTLTAQGADQVIQQYTRERQTEVGQQGVGGARDVTNAVADQARDAQRVVDIMRDQNVSMERAQSLLQTEKALREAIAKSAADTTGESKRQLETEQQNTAEMQRQAAISANAAQNLQTANDVTLQNQYERAINALPLNQQGAARAALPAILRAQQARQGGTANLVGLRPPGQDTGFQNFTAPEDSVAAGIRQLQTNQDTHHLSTLTEQITRWAPPKENDTAGYIQRVAKETGLDPNAPLNTHDQEIVRKVITAIVGVETGRAADPNVIARGVTQAFTGVGTTVRGAAAGGPTNLPGAPNTELDAATRALTEQFRIGQETANVQQQGQFDARQAVDRQRLQLIAQGRIGEAERLQPADATLPADLQQADVQRRTAGVVSGQQQHAVSDMQQTRAATADLTRETDALNKGLNGGAAAFREVDAQIQAHNEALRAGPGIIDENVRAQDLLTKSLAEQGKALAANTLEQQKSQEVQRALNNAGPFASDLDLAKARRDTELQRRFADTPGLEQSPEGQQAIQANRQQDQLDQATQSMNEYRSAAREASSAIANSFQAVATGAETGKQGALELAKTLEGIALKVLVTQPLEHMMQGLLNDVFGGGGGQNGQGGQGSGGGSGGSGGSGGGSLFGGIGNFFSRIFGGGGGGSGSSDSAAARGDGSGGGGVAASSGSSGADVQNAANDNSSTGIAANDNSPGIFASAASSVAGAASGSGGGGGGLSSIFSHAGGAAGWLIDKIGGQGFYKGGGLIGSLFGGSGKGGGGSGGAGGDSPLWSSPANPSVGDTTTDPFGTNWVYAGPGGSGVDSAPDSAPDTSTFARGGMFSGSKALRAYENQIVEAPTVFRFASGGSVGIMGEAGPEAILPLKRGANGQLGISAGAVQQTNGPTIHNWNITAPSPDAFMNSRRQIESKMGASIGRTQQRNST